MKPANEGALGRVLSGLVARLRGLRGVAAGMRGGFLGRVLAGLACLALRALRLMVVLVALVSFGRYAELAGVQGLVEELALKSSSTKHLANLQGLVHSQRKSPVFIGERIHSRVSSSSGARGGRDPSSPGSFEPRCSRL